MKPTTRSRVLDYLHKHQTATGAELSRALGMTGANIRHHLAVLESSGAVEMVGQRREGRGRPVNVYGLSRQVLGDALDKLSGAVLAVWLDAASDVEREAGLRSVAGRLAGDDSSEAAANLQRRLAGTVERLNSLHYQARWEASPTGPRLVLGHCPFSAIIASHPELCRLDAYLLEARLGQPVEQTAKLQETARGLPFCAFTLAPRR